MTLIDMDEYQEFAQETAIYPNRGEVGGLLYAALGLAGEAGEVANKVKKILRDDNGVLTEERRNAILKEVGGVQWYVAAVATELKASLADVAAQNVSILADRAERGVLTGSGDER